VKARFDSGASRQRSAPSAAPRLTFVVLDTRRLTSRSFELPVTAPRWACVAAVLLFLASSGAGWGAGGLVGAAEPGRLLALPTALRASSLHAVWARIPNIEELAVPGTRPKPESAAVVRERVERLRLGTLGTAGALLAGIVKPELIAEAATGSPEVETLRWPVDGGWFVRGYGSGSGGYHLAVDVAAPVGNRVRAAAPGIVAFADDTVRGYGNLLLLVHANGWVTAYAHNSKLRVSAGQRVTAGQLVAEVGSTGISRGPHVHFELMHHGKNCDPISLFRPAVLHRSGEPSEVAQASWDVREGRPQQVKCGHRRLHPHSARRAHRSEASEGSHDADLELGEPAARVAAAPSRAGG
jgi:hypothetical protein